MADKKKQRLIWLIVLGVIAGIIGYKIWYRQSGPHEHGGTAVGGKEHGGKEQGGKEHGGAAPAAQGKEHGGTGTP